MEFLEDTGSENRASHCLSCRARRLALRFISGVLGVLWFGMGTPARLPKSAGSCTPGVPKHRHNESNRFCIVCFDSIGAVSRPEKLENFPSVEWIDKKGEGFVYLPNSCTIDSVDFVPTTLLKSSNVTTEMKYIELTTFTLTQFSIPTSSFDEINLNETGIRSWEYGNLCFYNESVPDLVRFVAVLFG